MNLILFLLRSSWQMLAIAGFTGFLSGVSSAGLIALISHAMSQNSTNSLASISWAFVGLALISLVTSIVSQMM
ncbi:MAG: ABC transporter ATP-binding protein, partial [Kovacikia sp.]